MRTEETLAMFCRILTGMFIIIVILLMMIFIIDIIYGTEEIGLTKCQDKNGATFENEYCYDDRKCSISPFGKYGQCGDVER